MGMCLGVFLDAFLERRFLEELVVLLLFEFFLKGSLFYLCHSLRHMSQIKY